jgi:tetratricopeptide (TPR) repeat protein
MTNTAGINHIGIQLKHVYGRKRNGQLHFRQGNIQKYLYFTDGELVHARTNLPQELLGEVLFRQGKITEDTFSRIDEFIEPRKSIGQILVENQLISREDLRDGLNYQMREITLNIFPNFLGSLSFQDKETLLEETFDVKINVPSLIEDGIRRMKYDSHLESMMTGMVPFHSSREFFFHLTEDEKEVYSAVSGDMVSDDLLLSRGFSPQLFWRSLYLFFCLDLIDLRDGEAGARTVAAPGPASTPPPAPSAPKAASSEPADPMKSEIRDVIEFADRLGGLTHYQVLEIKRNASTAEVKKAYFQKARKYHPDLFDRNLPIDIKTKIDLAFDHITKAYHTLSDQDERKEYDKKTQEAKEGGGRQEVAKQAEVKFRQAKTLLDQTRFKEALIYLEEAIRLNDSKSKYFLLLALTQSKIPDYHRKAVENYKKAIGIEPWSVDGYLGLGMLYKCEGMPVMAAKQFKKALMIDSDNRAARKELDEIEPGSKASGLKDLLSGDLGSLLKRFRKKG